MRPLIYVSGPITGSGAIDENRRVALEVAEQVYKLGGAPFVPHLLNEWHDAYPKSWQEWIEYDLAVLLRCQAMLRIPGRSPGADVEESFATEHGIPIYYSVSTLKNDVWVYGNEGGFGRSRGVAE